MTHCHPDCKRCKGTGLPHPECDHCFPNRPPQPTPGCEHKNKYASRCDDECACDLLHIMCKDCGEYIDTIETDFETYPKQQPHEGTGEEIGWKENLEKYGQDWRERLKKVLQQVWKHKHNENCEWECSVAKMAMSEIEDVIAKEIEREKRNLNNFAYEIRDALKRNRVGKIRAAVWDVLKKYSALTPPTNHKDTPV